MTNSAAAGLKINMSDLLDAAEVVKISVTGVPTEYDDDGKIIAPPPQHFIDEWSYNHHINDGIDAPFGTRVLVMLPNAQTLLVFDNTQPVIVIDNKAAIKTIGGRECILHLYGGMGTVPFIKKDLVKYWRDNDSVDPYLDHNNAID